MSDTSQGPGWWQASDGKWYPPEQHPQAAAPVGPTVLPVPDTPAPDTAEPTEAPDEPSAGEALSPPNHGDVPFNPKATQVIQRPVLPPEPAETQGQPATAPPGPMSPPPGQPAQMPPAQMPPAQAPPAQAPPAQMPPAQMPPAQMPPPPSPFAPPQPLVPQGTPAAAAVVPPVAPPAPQSVYPDSGASPMSQPYGAPPPVAGPPSAASAPTMPGIPAQPTQFPGGPVAAEPMRAPVQFPAGPVAAPIAGAPITGTALPAAEKKRGAGRIILVLLVVIILLAGAAAVYLFVLNKPVTGADAATDTGIATLNATSEKAPQYDLHLKEGDLKCDGKGNQLTASGSVTNHSAASSDYEIAVDFRQNQQTFASGQAKVTGVAPEATVNWSVTVSADISGQFSCKVINVNRFNAGTTTPN